MNRLIHDERADERQDGAGLPRETTDPLMHQRIEAGAMLSKRFLHANGHFYARGDGRKVAFTDDGKRLTTTQHDPTIIHGMLLRAQEKGWTALHISGSAEFNAEAWLRASLAGLQVSGYRPQDIDRARFAERTRDDTRKITHGASTLTAQQQLAVTTLEHLLRERGDSESMIRAARAEAQRRLKISDREPVMRVYDPAPTRTEVSPARAPTREQERAHEGR